MELGLSHSYSCGQPPTPPSMESALLCSPGKLQGSLSHSISLICCKCHGVGGHLSLFLTITWQTRGVGLAVPLTKTHSRLTCVPTSRIGITMVPRWGAGSVLLNAIGNEGWWARRGISLSITLQNMWDYLCHTCNFRVCSLATL